ncbi:MAG: transketolase C-terminal domain-containing protein, partial [Rikenellaceae bacterium]
INHQRMVDVRKAKVERVANYIPELKVVGNEQGGDLLVVAWGGTYGHMLSAVEEMREQGKDVSLAHFNYIYPLPRNTREVFSKYKTIIVCELNIGQFASYLRQAFQDIKFEQFGKVQGLPFTVIELKERFNSILSK